jgi:hypothetical protein
MILMLFIIQEKNGYIRIKWLKIKLKMYVEAYIGICPMVLFPILLCILFSFSNVHDEGAHDYLVQSG